MLTRFFPFVKWFEDYNLDSFRIDVVSGLTVALVLIPQSMAYAQLAGLPPYHGLYASFLPPMVAALFGSSRQLATGPVAVVSLMTSASLEPLAMAGSEGYITYAILLALVVGIFQFLLGVLRLGLVVNLLSHPVVNGFTNAAAIIIASSQLSKLFGVHVDKAEHHYETIARVCQSATHYTHWPTFFMGVAAFVIMYVLRRVSRKVPNVLVAVVVTTVVSWAIGFERDVEAEITAIHDPDVVRLIEKFNDVEAQIPVLCEERTRVNERLAKAREEGDVFDEIDAERDRMVLEKTIELRKHEAGELRSRLRGFLLARVTEPSGRSVFVPQTEDVASDASGTWRLNVGETTLNTADLHFTGGGKVVGVIPRGLPAVTIPPLNIGVFLQLLPYAIIISLLGFMEAISIAKAMAAKTGQRLDPNQELVGQGLANIFGAAGKSYPTSGSFSRSAVNLQAGAVSGMSSVFTSIAVIVVLIFFTPLLYHLPQAVLAAVIMMAVIGLVNVNGFLHAWRVKKHDGIIAIITFVCTLAFAPHLDKGIMVGVALSLGVFFYKVMRPTVVSLSRHEDTAFRSSFAYNLAECKYVDLIRFDGPLFFANASYLEDKINERLRRKKDLKHIVIAANGISDVDASGEESLSLIIDRVRSAGVDISLSGVNYKVMEVLRRTFLLEKIGLNHVYPTMEIAMCSVHEGTHLGGGENACPLTTVCRIMRSESIRS
jgi:MFS superfamily sulfate permease-like transporter